MASAPRPQPVFPDLEGKVALVTGAFCRLGRHFLGQPSQLDGALLLLASEASHYITGAVLPVDGGHLVSSL